MDCNKEKTADEQNDLQELSDIEFQQNIANATDDKTSTEPIESRTTELEEQNTNIEPFVDRDYNDKECVEVLNFLKTLGTPLNEQPTLTTPCAQNSNNTYSSENIFHRDTPNFVESSPPTTENCEINIEDANVNLFIDSKSSELSDKHNELITLRTATPESDSVRLNIPIQQFVLESSNKMDVESQDAELESTNMRAHNQISSNDFETRIKMFKEVGETNTSQIHETSESYKVYPPSLSTFFTMCKAESQTLLIQQQDIAEEKINQISDSCDEFMNINKIYPEILKRKISEAFHDNEQSFKDKMLRSQKIPYKRSHKSQWNENTPLEIETKILIHNKYTSTNPLTSSLLINPLTSIEPAAELQSEHHLMNDEYNEKKPLSSEFTTTRNNENTFDYIENSAHSQSILDANTYIKTTDGCFIANETETNECETMTSEVEDICVRAHIMNPMVPKNTEQLLNRDEHGINERNTLVPINIRQRELESSPKVGEEKKYPDLTNLKKSPRQCSFDSAITEVLGDDVELQISRKIKTTERIAMQELSPSSTQSPQQMNFIKPHNLEQPRSQQMSDFCSELVDITETSKRVHKRKFSTMFLQNESLPFKANTLRSHKIQNRSNSPKYLNEATHLTSKTKSLQICNKETLPKLSISNLLTYPSKGFEVNEVLRLKSDERNLGRDEYDSQRESNTILTPTLTISSENTLVKCTENYLKAPKSELDGTTYTLLGDLSFNESEIECKSPTFYPKNRPVDNPVIIPIETESTSQEYHTVLSDISCRICDKTDLRKTENPHCYVDTEDIAFGDNETAGHSELQINEISSTNEVLDETTHSLRNSLSEESILSNDTKSKSLLTSLTNISETDGSYKLIKLYLENVEDREFRVENMVNFIKEHDPSISYFSALHATRIFLKNALRNEKLKMINGYYLIPPTGYHWSSAEKNETLTKSKSTLKCQLKKMINRHYTDTQTVTPQDNNIPQENKIAELEDDGTAARNRTRIIAEPHLHGSRTPPLQDKQESNAIDSEEKHLSK